MNTLNLKWILVDGLLFSAGLFAAMLIALRINPRIMLQDYPEEIKAQVPPQTPREKRQTLVLGMVWLVIIIVSLVHFIGQLRAEAGSALTFPALLLNVYLMFMVFNLIDWLILDLLILTVWKPKAFLIKGFENFGFRNPVRHHTVGFLKGMVILLVPSLIAALLGSIG